MYCLFFDANSYSAHSILKFRQLPIAKIPHDNKVILFTPHSKFIYHSFFQYLELFMLCLH